MRTRWESAAALAAAALVAFFAASASASATRNSNRQRMQTAQDKRPDRLLVVVIGGFRWDYLSRFSRRSRREFRGFDEFQRQGVRTRFLKSVFPSEDFPSWRSITTGMYPGDHGIIGNQFFDPSTPQAGSRGESPNNRLSRPTAYFDHNDERSTGEVRWWERAKPIWATAMEQGINFTTLLWGRCDLDWYDTKTMKPAECESIFAKDNSKTLSIQLETALGHFQQGKTHAALIYEGSLKEEAEQYGPLSKNVEQKLRDLDGDIQNFMDRLRLVNMHTSVNVVIMSDHGMTYGSDPRRETHPPGFPGTGTASMGIRKLHLGRALRNAKNKVKRVVGSGAYSMVWPKERYTMDVLMELRKNLAGCDVYLRNEIPHHLHWVNNFNTPPILVVAHNGTVLLRAGVGLQRPRSGTRFRPGAHGAYDTVVRVMEQTRQGMSGYDPEEEDMRGVFMARGPGFKDDGGTYDEIELVDVYSMFCHLLGIRPEENDGVWERIKALLRNGALAAAAAPGMAALAAISAAVVALADRRTLA